MLEWAWQENNSLLKHPCSKEHFRKRVKGESRGNEKPNASFQSPMPAIRGQMDQRSSWLCQPSRRPLPLSFKQSAQLHAVRPIGVFPPFYSRLFALYSIAQCPSGTCDKAVSRPFKFAPVFDSSWRKGQPRKQAHPPAPSASIPACGADGPP